MSTKTVKISEENYRQLTSIAGEMQRDEGRSVSVDEALRNVLARPKPRKSMLDLAKLKDDKEFIKALEDAYKESRKDMGRRIPSW
jgi:predicted CopG family antitoxin